LAATGWQLFALSGIILAGSCAAAGRQRLCPEPERMGGVEVVLILKLMVAVSDAVLSSSLIQACTCDTALEATSHAAIPRRVFRHQPKPALSLIC
jgi:hypothetical protein